MDYQTIYQNVRPFGNLSQRLSLVVSVIYASSFF